MLFRSAPQEPDSSGPLCERVLQGLSSRDACVSLSTGSQSSPCWSLARGEGVSRTSPEWSQHWPPLQSFSGAAALEGRVQAPGPPGECRASNRRPARAGRTPRGPRAVPGPAAPALPPARVPGGSCLVRGPPGPLPLILAPLRSCQQARRQRCSSRFQARRTPPRPDPLPSGWPPLSSGCLPTSTLVPVQTTLPGQIPASSMVPDLRPPRLPGGPPLFGVLLSSAPPKAGPYAPSCPPVTLVALVLRLPGLLPGSLSWLRSTCVRGCSFRASGSSPCPLT